MRISLIGSGSRLDEQTEQLAEDVGRLLAEREHTLVCGGMGGVMRAACRGAHESDGETIGILPTDSVADVNRFVTTPIETGMGHARNMLVPLNGRAVIAIAGGGGTLSEHGFSRVYDRPVAGLNTHDLPWIAAVDTPDEAVNYVEATAATNR